MGIKGDYWGLNGSMENSRWEFRSPVTKTTAGISAKIYLYHHSPKYIFISPKYIFISPKYIFISPKYIYITIHHHQQHNPKTPALCDEASIRLITNMQELHFPCFLFSQNKCFWCIWITGPMLCKTWSEVLFRFEVSLSGRKIYFSDQKDSSKFWIILFCWNGGGHCNCNPPSRIMG